MKKTSRRFPIKIILIIFLSLAAIFLPLFGLIRYLTTADYFMIKDSLYFSGQNIFTISLQKEARRLMYMYPDYKAIAIHRLLPNKVIIDFQSRHAVALLRLSDDFYVDEERVLFRPWSVADGQILNEGNSFRFLSQQHEEDPSLPLIIGLDTRIPYPRAGAESDEETLQAIVEFISRFNKDRELSGQIKIKEINSINIDDIFLFTANGSKINLGSSRSLNKNMLILKRLINEVKPDLDKVEYIELRFREPVIKYK
ncbi:MAG: cell division protein FtsQ/DivIB [Candidatus Omnitrophota bacterium]